jgi:hypothetical protein
MQLVCIITLENECVIKGSIVRNVRDLGKLFFLKGVLPNVDLQSKQHNRSIFRVSTLFKLTNLNGANSIFLGKKKDAFRRVLADVSFPHKWHCDLS